MKYVCITLMAVAAMYAVASCSKTTVRSGHHGSNIEQVNSLIG